MASAYSEVLMVLRVPLEYHLEYSGLCMFHREDEGSNSPLGILPGAKLVLLVVLASQGIEGADLLIKIAATIST